MNNCSISFALPSLIKLEREDALATLKAFQKMGVKIERDGDKVVIHGVGLHGLKQPDSALRNQYL
jgi:5-enolpyruvylshikimate-3-phosphate synthase